MVAVGFTGIDHAVGVDVMVGPDIGRQHAAQGRLAVLADFAIVRDAIVIAVGLARVRNSVLVDVSRRAACKIAFIGDAIHVAVFSIAGGGGDGTRGRGKQ